MFPALALAHDLIARGKPVVFLTDERGRKFVTSQDGLTIHVISSATFPKGLMGKIKAVTVLARGWIQSRRLIAQYKPGVVIGFGGYPSLPPMVAAGQKKIPTIIHEQNAVLGRANAYLASKADKIALSLDNMTSLNPGDASRVTVTGNPVRAEIAALYTHPYSVPEDDKKFGILVMGGSQGARIMRDVVPAALISLPQDLRDRLYVMQQCHEEDISAVRKIYAEAGIHSDIRSFFDDVSAVLKQAHLVISRSGASTVAEVAIVGCPAIYVPFAHHVDQQQKVNAETVSSCGGAWILEEKDFSPVNLASKIKSLIRSPADLFRAAEAARSCAKPDAARKLGDLVIALQKGWDNRYEKQILRKSRGE